MPTPDSAELEHAVDRVLDNYLLAEAMDYRN
jgi:hypothetical protein